MKIIPASSRMKLSRRGPISTTREVRRMKCRPIKGISIDPAERRSNIRLSPARSPTKRHLRIDFPWGPAKRAA